LAVDADVTLAKSEHNRKALPDGISDPVINSFLADSEPSGVIAIDSLPRYLI
jgi:hypothetical protein